MSKVDISSDAFDWKAAWYALDEEHRAQAERIKELEDHISDLLVDLPCACGHDNPGDVCLKHMPKFKAAQERIAELEAVSRQWFQSCESAEAEAKTARNDALREAAEICREYSKDHGTGMFDVHSAECERRILALIEGDTND